MKLSEWIGQIVDIYTINGNYYREVEIIDVDEEMHGLFIKDNPRYGGTDQNPYFISGIVELYMIVYEGESETIAEKLRTAYKKEKKPIFTKQKQQETK
jgi:hypothetical protein